MYKYSSTDDIERLALREHAAYELHKAQSWPVQTAEHIAAEKGLSELAVRKGRDGLARADRRLRTKYLATLKAEEVTPIQHAHDLGFLDADRTSAAVRLGLLHNHS